MTRRCDYVLTKSEIGFKRYIREYIEDFRPGSFRYKILREQHFVSDEEKIEREKYTLLNSEFESLLTDSEKDAIKYLQFHTNKELELTNYKKLLSSAYQKWVKIFFNKSNRVYKTISPILLGEEISLLLENSDMNKTDLADMLGVNRAAISLITNGKRLPNLDLIYKISIIFKISMDEMLNMSLL